MLDVSRIIVLLSFSISLSVASNDCTLLSSKQFTWLNSSTGSLVLPASATGVNTVTNESKDLCCGVNCTEQWQPLEQNPNCQFCVTNSSLFCHGSDVYSVPSPSSLPSTNLTLFKMTGVGLIALPPKSFTGLSIQRLVIEDSNLTYIATNTFAGVKSVQSLRLRNNTLDYLMQAEYSFKGLHDLKVLDLGSNGLRVLSSMESANLNKLEYFSLAGNPIYTMDVFFLKNSSLKYLDFRSVNFKVKPEDLEESGLASLPKSLGSLDLSRATISVKLIGKMMTLLSEKNISTLNLAFLEQSDTILSAIHPLRKPLQYLSLEGTDMSFVFPLKEKEKKFIISKPFTKLRELNMKNCEIQNLGSGEVFQAFPNLKVLSISGNKFVCLDLLLFTNLPSLSYLDLSKNSISELVISLTLNRSYNSTPNSVKALDLSFLTFDVDKDDAKSFFQTFPQVEMLSLCSSKINTSGVEALELLKELKILDLSATLPNKDVNMITAYYNLFAMQTALTELHFTDNSFAFPSIFPTFFSSLTSLKTLDLSNNLIRELSQSMFGSQLESLKLSQNLITTWYESTVSNGSQLRSVDLSNNQITFVSEAMIQDFYRLNSLNLNSNPLICNNRVVETVCASVDNKMHNLTMVNWRKYQCYDVLSSSYRLFLSSQDCTEYFKEVTTESDREIDDNTTEYPTHSVHESYYRMSGEWTSLIIGFSLLSIVLGSVVYVKWWNIRCYFHRYCSMRKARLLRKYGEPLIKPEMQYDVFVSYSDVDRSWVLDHLIPNMEADGDVSLCFHERDFQVGMTILENIIECMDRSHCLLLIVSSAFVRSKWCQFEMHLAQYRLIETIRDQLVLVLLEDIPRRSRPQTLHHLMMTKTYLVWPHQPCKEETVELFWKRLRRALKPNHMF